MSILKKLFALFLMALSVTSFSFVVAVVFSVIAGTEFGQNFVWHFTGGHPEISVIILGCIISFFVVESVSNKFYMEKEIKWASKVLMILSVIFAAINIIHAQFYDALKNVVLLAYLYATFWVNGSK